MATYDTGTATFTNGDATVTFVGSTLTSNAEAGDQITIPGSGVTYEIGSITDDLNLELTSEYAGDTVSGSSYVIIRSFTANYGFPYPEPGDLGTVTILKRALNMIDAEMATLASASATLTGDNAFTGDNTFTTGEYTLTLVGNGIYFDRAGSNYIDATAEGGTIVLRVNGEDTNTLYLTADQTVRVAEALTVGTTLTVTGVTTLTGGIALASGKILVGGSDGASDAVTMTGHGTLSNTGVFTLGASGVTAGTYAPASVTVDTHGRVTAASSTTVSIAHGGTGATTESAARTALGLAIGTNVQAYDADTAKTDVANTWSEYQRISDSTHTLTLGYNALGFSGGGGYITFERYMALYVNGASAATGDYAVAIWLDGSGIFAGAMSFTGNVYPTTADTYTCGLAASAWSGGYTQTAFTTTSDKNYKTVIELLKANPALCKFAYALGGIITVFQLNTAIANKTAASARYHIGLIAQEVETLAETYSLDLDTYGLYCYDDVYTTTTATTDSDGQLVNCVTSEDEADALSADTSGVESSTDENGTVTLTLTKTATDGTVTAIETVHMQRYSLRYQEIAMLIAGAQWLVNEALRTQLSLTIDDIFPDSDSSTDSTES